MDTLEAKATENGGAKGQEDVTDMLDLMHSGEISKAELFGKLSAMYDIDPDLQDIPPPEPEPKKVEPPSDKRVKIENLLQDFERSLQGQEANGESNETEIPIDSVAAASALEVSPPLGEEILSPHSPAATNDFSNGPNTTEEVLKTLKDSMNADTNFTAEYEEDDISKFQNDSSLESRYRYNGGPTFSPRSVTSHDDVSERFTRRSTGPRSKEARIKQLKKIMRSNEQKECTFKPKTKALPKMYTGNQNKKQPLVKRLYAWQSKKTEDKLRISHDLSQSKIKECTFKPRLNSTSKRLSSAQRQDICNVSLRSQARAKLVEREIRRQNEEVLMENCTFKPHINDNSRRMVESKRSIQSFNPHNRRKEQRLLLEAMKDCTFTPKTNGIKPDMQAAAVYLDMSPFERLSQPTRTYSNSGLWPDKKGTKAGGKSKMSQGFYERNMQHLERKKIHRERMLQLEKQKMGNPKLNKVSVSLTGGSSFMDRLEKDSTRRSQERLRREEQQAKLSANCTFTPKINIMSQNLKGRSVAEMSEGDTAMKTTKLELARMYARKQELSTVTFRPKRKTKNNFWDNRAQSTIKQLNSDPTKYTEMLSKMREKKKEKIRRHEKEKQDAELEQCTFKPKVHEPPEYVKSTLANRSLSRRKREPPAQEKPSWR